MEARLPILLLRAGIHAHDGYATDAQLQPKQVMLCQGQHALEGSGYYLTEGQKVPSAGRSQDRLYVHGPNRPGLSQRSGI